MLNKLLELYSRNGFSLTENEIPSAIIPIKFSLQVLEILLHYQIVILGGDIYERGEDGNFYANYSNWYYEGNDSKESIFSAKNYLSKCNPNEFVLFVFKE